MHLQAATPAAAAAPTTAAGQKRFRGALSFAADSSDSSDVEAKPVRRPPVITKDPTVYVLSVSAA